MKSDLVAGVELVEVRVTLLDDGTELDPVIVARNATLADPGIRIARISGLSPSPARRVQVVAYDVLGEEVTRQIVVVVNRDDAATTILVTRDCRGVTCDDADTRCLGSRCVDQACLTGAEDSCPDPVCTVDTECAGLADCATPRCNNGVCVAEEIPGQCGNELYCDAARGCLGVPLVLEQCDMRAFVAPGSCEGDCQVRVRNVSAAHLHTCYVDTEGETWCMGANDHGELGTGDLYGRLEPARVELPAASLVACGDNFTCALLESGEIRCWGTNDDGQLGQGDTEDRLAPTPIAGGPWLTLSIEYNSACAIDTMNRLFCWGRNLEGQAGSGSEDVLTPTQIDGSWASLGQGQGHTCGIQTDGSLWCWGRNSDAQLGQPEGAARQIRRPTQVGADTDWAQVDGAQESTCALKTDGSLWCWGTESNLNLAFGDEVTYEPRQRTDGTDWTDIDISVFHGCGLRGDVGWCWGRGFEGQTGVAQSDPLMPRMVDGPWADVEVGRFSSFFVRDDGALFASGASCGRLGTGSPERPNMFVEISR